MDCLCIVTTKVRESAQTGVPLDAPLGRQRELWQDETCREAAGTTLSPSGQLPLRQKKERFCLNAALCLDCMLL